MSYLTYLGVGLLGLLAGFLLAYFACRRNQARLQNHPNLPSKATADPPPPTREGPDASYFEKLLKFIPGELVAAYLALDGVLREALIPNPVWAYWIVFASLLILTPLYVIYRPTHNELADHSERFHAWAATVAFAVWVFALGGPFAITWPALYHPVYGSLLLIVTTLALPVVETAAKKLSWFR